MFRTPISRNIDLLVIDSRFKKFKESNIFRLVTTTHYYYSHTINWLSSAYYIVKFDHHCFHGEVRKDIIMTVLKCNIQPIVILCVFKYFQMPIRYSPNSISRAAINLWVSPWNYTVKIYTFLFMFRLHSEVVML